MSGRLGLVSYTGDSEISDEDEFEHETPAGRTPPGVAMQRLGIPPSRSSSSGAAAGNNPLPSLAPPVVQSAPLLVDYHMEDEDMNESRTDDVFTLPVATTKITKSEGGFLQLPIAPEDIDDATKSDTEFDSTSSRPPLFLPLNNARLPPEPPGKCSKALQDKVVALLEKEQRLGLDLNHHLQGRKDFRNPSIYEKLVEVLGLDELGTNFPEHLYDPKNWGEESNYKNLLEAQKKAYEKKERAKVQERTKIEFVKGTKRPAVPASSGGGGGVGGDSGGGGGGGKKARRSKWDVSTGNDSSGSKGNSPSSKVGEIGAQARAQASQINKELSKLAK